MERRYEPRTRRARGIGAKSNESDSLTPASTMVGSRRCIDLRSGSIRLLVSGGHCFFFWLLNF